ncbi:MAG: flagellar biosynthetic protein FliR [Spirochaetota bacterium]
MEYFVENFQIFLLVLVRMLSMFVVAPFFSSGTVPLRVRAAMAAFITVCIFPMVANYFGSVPENMFSYAMLIGSEAIIGLLIGFMVSIIFAAFQLAARFFSFQMALGIAEVVDPFSEVGITIVGQLWTLMGLMVFIAIDGPHMLVMAVFDSYKKVQLFNIVQHGQTMFTALVSSFGAMFLVAMKLAFPILITLFLLSVTLGLLAKAAPQMNIFMVGFPIQISVGFIIMIAVIGAIAFGMSNALDNTFKHVSRFVGALGG